MNVKLSTVYGIITNNGDGSGGLKCFLTSKDAEDFKEYEENHNEGTLSDNYERIETYEGSNVYHEALENSEELRS